MSRTVQVQYLKGKSSHKLLSEYRDLRSEKKVLGVASMGERISCLNSW